MLQNLLLFRPDQKTRLLNRDIIFSAHRDKQIYSIWSILWESHSVCYFKFFTKTGNRVENKSIPSWAIVLFFSLCFVEFWEENIKSFVAINNRKWLILYIFGS